MERNAKDLIEALSSGPVRQYLSDHEHDDIREIILKHKEILGIPTARLLEQVSTRRKAKDKLPAYYRNDAVVYPPPENFEQSSSEKTAAYKAGVAHELIEHRRRAADLTGGFGVDTYFLASRFEIVDYIEPDNALLELARHNHRLLGADNIRYHLKTAEDFLRATDTRYDVIYIDPSRRPQRGKKVHALEDSQPDVLKMLGNIFLRSDWLIIKTSPLFDIQAGISKIPFTKHVFVVSVDNECKEVLYVAQKGFSDTPTVNAINITGDSTDTFEFNFPEERNEAVEYGDPAGYLYEPNASILKAGAFKTVARRFSLRKLHPSTHLYTGDRLLEEFPGRRFRIEALVKPDRSEVLRHFPEGKGNVTTRNYPLTPEALKKRTGLKDGGDKFLIGFSGQKRKFLVVANRV